MTTNKMKVLIGTPTHEIKDYAMTRWLENVSKLKYPADLLLVDNSPGTDYVQKVRSYCNKYGLKNYQIKHLDINQEQGADERIGRSREIIRQYILSHNYDAWFSWECDQIIPTNALDKLIAIMKEGNFMLVAHNSPGRIVQTEPIAAFGITLIKREPLEKYGFLLEYPNMPNVWHGGERWFKKKILQGGGNYIEIFGVIKPIYHLNQ